MELESYLPFWADLADAQRRRLKDAARPRRFARSAILHNGSEDCIGLLLVTSGRLRAYLLSAEGKEVTLFRLLERDLCLFSASCIFRSIEFDITVEAEEDTSVLHIPSDVYRSLMESSLSVAAYTNELMASRFSDVMWLMDQVLHKKLDARLAALLIEEGRLSGSRSLQITHERLAQHLGSVREVVTRMLRYFQNEGLVRLTRGGIELLDTGRLEALAVGSLR